MGLGSIYKRQFILLIDFASVLIVFILKLVSYFSLSGFDLLVNLLLKYGPHVRAPQLIW